MSSQPFRISLLLVFWAMSLVAGGIGAFGVWGIPIASFILLLWYVRPSVRAVFWFIVISGAVLLFLLPAVRLPREAARRVQCLNNLKQIGLGILNYRDIKGHWPPAFIADENGVPMHSWRVLILPYMEEGAVFDRYRFDEPWDGPNNLKLIKEMPWVYQCPSNSAQPGKTRYSAVVGPKTIWAREPTKPLPIDPPAQPSAMVCETFKDVPWTKPTDFDAEELIGNLEAHSGQAFAGGHQHDTFWTVHQHQVSLLYSDGSVRFFGIPHELDNLRNATLGALNGLPASVTEYRWKWGRLVSIACFVLLSLAPFWHTKLIARGPESQRQEPVQDQLRKPSPRHPY